MRLVYDGRNGRPYTSIGRRLIEAGEIPEAEMSLAALKGWLRANGLEPGERGRELMRAKPLLHLLPPRRGSKPGGGPDRRRGRRR